MSLRHLLAVVGVVVAVAASASAPAGTSGQGPVPAAPNEKSWRTHPAIVAIRAIVEANEAAVRSGTWRRTENHVCSLGEGQVAKDRVAYRDRAGTVRKYVTIEGTDDSAYTLEHQFDEQGRLRFVFGTSGAVNAAVVEYRLYFALDGALIWRDRRETGPGYTFMAGFPEASIVRDAGRDWAAPATCSAGAADQAGPGDPVLVAGRLRAAILRDDVEAIIQAIHPRGLRVGDAAILQQDAVKDLRSKGRLYAKYFDTKRRREIWAAVAARYEVLSFRDWFERYPDAVAEVEEHRLASGQVYEATVSYLSRQPEGRNEAAPSFSFCIDEEQWKICSPPDDL